MIAMVTVMLLPSRQRWGSTNR